MLKKYCMYYLERYKTTPQGTLCVGALINKKTMWPVIYLDIDTYFKDNMTDICSIVDLGGTGEMPYSEERTYYAFMDEDRFLDMQEKNPDLILYMLLHQLGHLKIGDYAENFGTKEQRIYSKQDNVADEEIYNERGLDAVFEYLNYLDVVIKENNKIEDRQELYDRVNNRRNIIRDKVNGRMPFLMDKFKK